MKKAIILFIFLVLQSIYSKAYPQIKEFPQRQNHLLFTFQQDSYLILDDSMYCISREKEGFPRVNDFVIEEYKFVANDSIGFLKNASSGVVYSFDGDNFTRLDSSFPFKSQFYSFSFLHEDNLMDFGGYGLHTYKNIITYFSFNKNETEVYKIKSPLSQMPSPRNRMVAQYSDGILYVGTGEYYAEDIEYPFNQNRQINDFWKFSFNTNKWEKLGEGIFSIPIPNTVLHHFNGNTLVLSPNKIREYDIQNNLCVEYKEIDLDILKSFDLGSWQDLTYNKAKDGFYIAINKPYRKAAIFFIKREALLGTKRTISPIYKPEKESNALILGGTAMILLLIGLSVLIYKRKKKTLASTMLSITSELEKELKTEDFKVLMKIAAADPAYINYNDLMDAFPDHLGYESKKKKLRLSLIFLEDYLEHKFKLKRPVFIIRKNIEDKREKQVKLS